MSHIRISQIVKPNGNPYAIKRGLFVHVAAADKDKPLKRGRGSQKKSKVLVMAESTPVERETTQKGKPRKVGHLKMAVIGHP